MQCASTGAGEPEVESSASGRKDAVQMGGAQNLRTLECVLWSTAIRSDWHACAGPWPLVDRHDHVRQAREADRLSDFPGIFTLLFCLGHSRFISMFVSKNYTEWAQCKYV